jgi:hypothetical protein|tara:strand:- start:2913 stop:3017 length:105 start_codon:yes stop_codon:yes gene_type:complete
MVTGIELQWLGPQCRPQIGIGIVCVDILGIRVPV